MADRVVIDTEKEPENYDPEIREAEAREARKHVQMIKDQRDKSKKGSDRWKHFDSRFKKDYETMKREYGEVLKRITKREREEALAVSGEGEDIKKKMKKSPEIGLKEIGQGARMAGHSFAPFGTGRLVDPEGAEQWDKGFEEAPLWMKGAFLAPSLATEGKIIEKGVSKLGPLLSKIPGLSPSKVTKSGAAVMGQAPKMSRRANTIANIALDSVSEGVRATIEGGDPKQAMTISGVFSTVINTAGQLANMLGDSTLFNDILNKDDSFIAGLRRKWDRSGDEFAEEIEGVTRHDYELPSKRTAQANTIEEVDAAVGSKTYIRMRDTINKFQKEKLPEIIDDLKLEASRRSKRVGDVPILIKDKASGNMIEETVDGIDAVDNMFDKTFMNMVGETSHAKADFSEITRLEDKNAIAMKKAKQIDSMSYQDWKEKWYNTEHKLVKGRRPKQEPWINEQVKANNDTIAALKKEAEDLVEKKKKVFLDAKEVPKEVKQDMIAIYTKIDAAKRLIKTEGRDGMSLGMLRDILDEVNTQLLAHPEKLSGKSTFLYEMKHDISALYYNKLVGSDRKAAIYSRYAQGRNYTKGLEEAKGDRLAYLQQTLKNPSMNNAQLMRELSDPNAMREYNKLLDELQSQGYSGSDLVREFNSRLDNWENPIHQKFTTRSRKDRRQKTPWVVKDDLRRGQRRGVRTKYQFDGDALDLFDINSGTKELGKNLLDFQKRGGLLKRLLVTGGIGLGASGVAYIMGEKGSGIAGSVLTLLAVMGIAGSEKLAGKVARNPEMMMAFKNPEFVSLAERVAAGVAPKRQAQKRLRKLFVEGMEQQGVKPSGFWDMSKKKAKDLMTESPYYLQEFILGAPIRTLKRGAVKYPARILQQGDDQEYYSD